MTSSKTSILIVAVCSGPLLATGGCADDGGSTDGTDTGTTGTATTPPTASSSVTSPTASTTGTPTTTTDETTTSGDPTTGGETTTGGTELTPFEQAVLAIGGEDALNDLELLQIDADGSRFIDYEGPLPGDSMALSTYVTTYTFDVPNEGFRLETAKTPLFEGFAFGPVENYGLVFQGNVGGLNAQAGFAPPGNLPSQVVGAVRTQQRLLNPHFYLREGLADMALVGDGGDEDYDGRPHRIITFDGEVSEIELFVDEETGLISKLETIENGVLTRDTPLEVRYVDWQSQGSLMFPDTVELYTGGLLVVDETRSAVEIEPDLPADHFDFVAPIDNPMLDADAYAFGQSTHQSNEGFFVLGFPYVEEPTFTSSQVVAGITLLGSQANTVVVSYDQGLVVLEAPGTPAHASNMIADLGLTFPTSAITHIIQSHHHQDHSAGVRSFVAEGATLVVGDGSATLWDDVLAAESTIRPDALDGVDVTPDVEEIIEDGTFVVSDANVTVTAHHVSSFEHSEDMVITVIDIGGARFVYEADVYNAGFGFTLVVGGPERFFAALRDLAIIDNTCASAVPLTIIPTHGVPQTLAESLLEMETLSIDVGCP